MLQTYIQARQVARILGIYPQDEVEKFLRELAAAASAARSWVQRFRARSRRRAAASRRRIRGEAEGTPGR